VGGHRHYPEIKQELALLAGKSVGLTFVPHLVPMIRGMQATLYVDLLDANTEIILDKSISLLSIRGLSANWMTVG
jgi:N-acetyl-gamma-glutamyl-phosphate reductase